MSITWLFLRGPLCHNILMHHHMTKKLTSLEKIATWTIMICQLQQLGGCHFLWNRGSWISKKYLGNLWITPLFDDQKFYDPQGATMHPNMCSMKICIFGAISLNTIFSKICSHPIISWLFLWSPYFSRKLLWSQLFHDPIFEQKCEAMYFVFHSNFAAYIVCWRYKPCEFLGFVWTRYWGN